MRSVIIGFSRPKKFKIGAAAIMLWMRAPYSHVYIKVYSPYLSKWLIYQASQGSVHCITSDNFEKQNTVYKEIAADVESICLRNFTKRVYELLGSPYGYVGLAKIVLRRMGVPVSGDGNKSFHCSELVATLLPNKFSGSPDFLEPVHIYRELVK